MSFVAGALIALSIVVIVLTLGFGFTALLLPDRPLAELLVVAPWVGYSYSVLVMWYIYLLGRSVNCVAVFILFVPAIIAFAWAAALRKRTSANESTNTQIAALAMIAFGGLIVVCLPAVRTGVVTTVSLGNNDIAQYAAMTRFLLSFVRHSTAAFSQNTIWQLDNGYFGAAAVNCLVSEITGQMPHRTTTICLSVFFCLAASTVFLVARRMRDMHWFAGAFVVVMCTFHPVLHYVLYQGFFGQVLGMGLSIVWFWTVATLASNSSAQCVTRLFILLLFFTVALLLTYQHMLPFIWFFSISYLAVAACLTRNTRILKRFLGFSSMAFLVAGVICPTRMLALYTLTRANASVTAGWFLPFLPLNYICGLVYRDSFLVLERAWPNIVVSTLIAAVVLIGLRQRYAVKDFDCIAFSAACLAIYIGCLVLGVKDRENGFLGGYKSFKLATFFIPFACVAVVSAFPRLPATQRGLSGAVRLGVIAIVFQGFATGDSGLLRIMLTSAQRVEPEYDDLLRVDSNATIPSVNVLGRNWWALMWKVYFLMHKEVSLEKDTYYAASPLNKGFDLIDRTDRGEGGSSSGIVHIGNATGPAESSPPPVIAVNGRFSLAQHSVANSVVTVSLTSGWYNGEANHVWSGNTGRSAKLTINAPEAVAVRLHLVFSPLRPNDEITGILNGERLFAPIQAKSTDVQTLNIHRAALARGANILEFISALEPSSPGNGDPRLLSYSFWAIDIDEIQSQ